MRPAHHSCASGRVHWGVPSRGHRTTEPQPRHHRAGQGLLSQGPGVGREPPSTPMCTPVAEGPASEQPWIRRH